MGITTIPTHYAAHDQEQREAVISAAFNLDLALGRWSGPGPGSWHGRGGGLGRWRPGPRSRHASRSSRTDPYARSSDLPAQRRRLQGQTRRTRCASRPGAWGHSGVASRQPRSVRGYRPSCTSMTCGIAEYGVAGAGCQPGTRPRGCRAHRSADHDTLHPPGPRTPAGARFPTVPPQSGNGARSG